MDIVICFGEVEKVEEDGAFNKASVPKRIAIVLAGGIVNIIFGIIIYFILSSCMGMNISTTVAKIIPEYANNISSLQVGDTIKQINGKTVRLKSDIDKQIRKSDGNRMDLIVERNGKEEKIEVIPSKLESGYILGIMVESKEKNLKNNLYYAFWDTIDFTWSIGENIKMIFTGNIKIEQMTGPIGIYNMVIKTNGLYDFVYLLSVISLSLGVTNLLPIPALDGGRIVLLIIEAIRRKPLDEKTELSIQSLGFTLLILLSLYISYKDIIRIF